MELESTSEAKVFYIFRVFKKHMDEKLMDIVFNEDEVNWKTMLLDLVKNEEMDPWDIDIKQIAEKFFEKLKAYKEMNFRMSGKVLLVAAIMLRLKSYKFIDSYIMELDKIIAGEQVNEEGFYDDLETGYYNPDRRLTPEEAYRLVPKMPQPRKRKVSIYDLVDALNKALEVKKRRVMAKIPDLNVVAPRKSVDMSQVIMEVYTTIGRLFKTHDKIMFSQLVPSNERDDKIMTFIPLLHLTNQRKIDLDQKEHFGEIEIFLATKKEVDRELAG